VAQAPNFYTLLGILRSASPAQIKRAYLKAVKRLHPDVNQVAGETEMFLDVQQAYQVLFDPHSRASYDASLPPEEKIEHPLTCRLQFSRPSVVRAAEPQLLYALMDVGATNVEPESAAPALNICLVLDCSTSMQGEKLDVVKATAIQLIRRMRAQDIFSVVTFNDRAEVLIPAKRNADLRRAETSIHTILTRGGTEIFQGLQAGMSEVRRHLNAAGVNHIILLTDGRTYGDEQACLDLGAEAAVLGVGISGLGIGNDWSDAFLDNLSHRTGGSCLYVSNPQDIHRFLLEKFETLARAFADDVTFEFELPAGVELLACFRVNPEPAPLRLETPIHLGPVSRDQELSILMEFSMHPFDDALDSVDILSGSINASISSSPVPVPPLPITISRSVTAESPSELPPPAVIQSISKLTLYRMQEKARDAVAAGDITKATYHLKSMATRLFAQGEAEFARTVLFEADNLERQQTFSQEGEKQIKYGTRALMLPPGKPKQ